MYRITRSFVITAFTFYISFSSLLSQNCTPDTVGLAAFLTTINLNENATLTFEVPHANSTFAVLHGFIDTRTPQDVDNFIATYPSVTTLVFMQVPGSDDDDANLVAAQKLRNRGYTSYIPAVRAYPQDAYIASGGVDLFISGTTRIIDVNAELGVHAWSDGTNEATDFPMNHPFHTPFINYYVAMGMTQQEASDFYFFTINAAPAADIHLMSEAEIVQYGLRKCDAATGPMCTDIDYVSNASINSNTTIYAQNSIKLSHSLSSALVKFYAGSEIDLNIGAEVNSTASLEVYLAMCSN